MFFACLKKRCFGYPGNVEKNVRKVSLFDVFLFFAYTVRTTRKIWGDAGMSIEVEIKVKIQNRKQVMDSLKKIGFLENRCVIETDIYYNSKHYDFAALGEALRIRTVKDPESPKETSVITYKGAKLDQVSMTRQELETEVGDGETVRKILEHIGFCPVSPVEKKRLYLNKDNMTACLDNVKGLGDYLELEILTDTEEKRTEALKQIEDVLEALGYSMEDTTRTSYLSMLMKKEKDGKDAQSNGLY